MAMTPQRLGLAQAGLMAREEGQDTLETSSGHMINKSPFNAQMDLFQTVQASYNGGSLVNTDLYERIVQKGALKIEQLTACDVQDQQGRRYSAAKRQVRWIQQSLKKLGLLESVGKRGQWRLTERGRRGVTPAQPRQVLLGFSTALGIALWGSCSDIFSKLDEPISLCLTSPPYPLARARAYGNPEEAQFADWICTMLEPIVKSLMPGGSVVLNVSNDIFLKGSPARSLYRERMVLALHDRLGLFKMDELIWHNPCKPPGPIQWASKERFQLNVAWEPVYWFTNDPSKVRSNNQRVLEPHTKQHAATIADGGEKTQRISGDGAHRVKRGAYANPTAGRIPRNLMSIRHNCIDQDAYKAFCCNEGLPTHGAAMPLALASKLICFLTEPDDLVVDPFGGSFTTAKAAQTADRRWVSTDLMAEYVVGAASRFSACSGFDQQLLPSNLVN